jgi:hypothetical protein
MLMLLARAMSLILGLGLLLGAFWGPDLKAGALIAALALLARATLPDERLGSFWALGLLSVGSACLVTYLALLVLGDGLPLEKGLQASVLLVCILLLSHVLLREGRIWWQRFGLR